MMDLNTRTNRHNIFVQNNLRENEYGKSCMKIRQREQQRGRDFDFRFLFFRDYDTAYSVLKSNVHVERKTAEESNVTNTLKEDKSCVQYKYRHNIFRAEWKNVIKVNCCV
jgi:formylmethanofuran dehydrogenase subunit E